MPLSAGDLAALVVTASALLAVPGPSVLHVIARAVAGGRRDALTAACGVGLGLLVQVVVVAAGLGGLVARSATAETVVRALGAIALVLLGVRAYRTRRDLAARTAGPRRRAQRGGGIREDVMIGALNPKRLLVLVALLPQFTADGGTPVALQLLVLGSVVAAVALVCDVAWGLLAASAGRRLRAGRTGLERLGALAGATMVLLGLHLGLTA